MVKRAQRSNVPYDSRVKIVAVHILQKSGDVSLDHTYQAKHSHILLNGSVRFECDGKANKEYHAPAVMDADPNVTHRIVALSNNVTYLCVYPTSRDNRKTRE